MTPNPNQFTDTFGNPINGGELLILTRKDELIAVVAKSCKKTVAGRYTLTMSGIYRYYLNNVNASVNDITTSSVDTTFRDTVVVPDTVTGIHPAVITEMYNVRALAKPFYNPGKQAPSHTFVDFETRFLTKLTTTVDEIIGSINKSRNNQKPFQYRQTKIFSTSFNATKYYTTISYVNGKLSVDDISLSIGPRKDRYYGEYIIDFDAKGQASITRDNPIATGQMNSILIKQQLERIAHA